MNLKKHTGRTDKEIRIGTRDSTLAIWQARQVQNGLTQLGIDSILVPVKSEGDLDLVTPLYEMGVEGIFTRTLDAHLLSHKIDIAVHSMKDVPIQLAAGIVQAAVLPRGNHKDVLLVRTEEIMEQLLHNRKTTGTIATSSIRRKAQWLSRYPGYEVESLRGNIHTRVQKLLQSHWDGAVFAAAGIERTGIKHPFRIDLDWMLPAPAQGAIMVVCREDDEETLQGCAPLNDASTEHCVCIERDFLAAMLGGCSAPIGAWAHVKGQNIHFTGNIYSADGKEQVCYSATFGINEYATAGKIAAEATLRMGGDKMMHKIKQTGN